MTQFFAAVLVHCRELHHWRIRCFHPGKQWRQSSITQRYHLISWHEKAPWQELSTRLVLLWHVISTGSRCSLWTSPSRNWKNMNPREDKCGQTQKGNVAGQVMSRCPDADLKPEECEQSGLSGACVLYVWLGEWAELPSLIRLELLREPQIKLSKLTRIH